MTNRMPIGINLAPDAGGPSLPNKHDHPKGALRLLRREKGGKGFL